MQKMKLFYKVMILYECVQFEFYAVSLMKVYSKTQASWGVRLGYHTFSFYEFLNVWVLALFCYIDVFSTVLKMYMHMYLHCFDHSL